jgi:uncharacterized membrane protein
MAAIFDLLSRAGAGGNVLVRLSFVCIGAGLIAALPAITTGALDWAEVKKEKPAWRLGLYHMLLNLVVFALFALNFGLRFPDWANALAISDAQLVLSLAATVLLGFSAWLGGRMVYQHGVGVARQSKDKWRSVAEAGGANVPEPKEKSVP